MKKTIITLHVKAMWSVASLLWTNAFSKMPICKSASLKLFSVLSNKATKLNAKHKLNLWCE